MASSEPEVPTWVKSDGDEHLFWAVFYANAPRAAFMSRISCSEWHKHQQSKLEPEKCTEQAPFLLLIKIIYLFFFFGCS
jgi:hypothetical protein